MGIRNSHERCEEITGMEAMMFGPTRIRGTFFEVSAGKFHYSIRVPSVRLAHAPLSALNAAIKYQTTQVPPRIPFVLPKYLNKYIYITVQLSIPSMHCKGFKFCYLAHDSMPAQPWSPCSCIPCIASVLSLKTQGSFFWFKNQKKKKKLKGPLNDESGS